MTRDELTSNRPGNGRAVRTNRGFWLILLFAIQAIAMQSAAAQTRGGALTLRYASISPFIALLAGILILIMPRLLNYVVAVYLILIGLIGILGA